MTDEKIEDSKSIIYSIPRNTLSVLYYTVCKLRQVFDLAVCVRLLLVVAQNTVLCDSFTAMASSSKVGTDGELVGNSCDKCQRYKDKVVIVTGGSKGIGEGCVRVFGKLYYI